MIDMFAVSGTSNMRVNGYMRRPSTGKELKDKEMPGLMFRILEYLREALITTAIKWRHK